LNILRIKRISIREIPTSGLTTKTPRYEVILEYSVNRKETYSLMEIMDEPSEEDIWNLVTSDFETRRGILIDKLKKMEGQEMEVY